MKQVVQKYRTGELRIADVPTPILRPGGVLVANRASLISAGTERMKVEVARKNLIGKALERPDAVKKVIDVARQQGVMQAYEKAMNKLDTLTPLGYSSAGVVMEVGSEATGFQIGDHVACAGAGYAVHADVVYVPKNLVVRMDEQTPFERGAFVTLGAIALQGVRQGEIRLGDNVAVVGLGLIGLLTVQLLKQSGARVIGIEPDERRRDLALQLGCDVVAFGSNSEIKDAVLQATAGRGADCALVAAASSSGAPVELAGEVCRDRGRVVVVGITKLDVPFRAFYEKELSIVLSRSYGPGRYDKSYEEFGVDYPIGYVRWTEGRNMEEFLRLVEEGRVQVDPLTTHRIPFADAMKAYDLFDSKTEHYLGIILNYPEAELTRDRVPLEGNGTAAGTTATALPARPGEKIGIGFLGAGNYAISMLLPHLKKRSDSVLTGVVTASGLSARNAAEKYGFRYCASEPEELIQDKETQVLFVVTRHDLHARLTAQALDADKAVFVEKPLATTREELAEVERSVADYESRHGHPAPIMVGFNRRFADLSQKLAGHFPKGLGPLVVSYRVNAGFLGQDSWYQDPVEGGGRILGEVCHFLDYIVFLTGSPIVKVFASGVRDQNGHWRADDNLTVTVECSDGSVGTVVYVAAGDATMPKERIEVMGRGQSAVLDNFASLTTWSGNKKKSKKALSVNKGQAAELDAWIRCLSQGGAPVITWTDIQNVSEATIATVESLASGNPVLITP
jgi:predicted dehydrogenase/NADPH:quinone reductase-like Zn-dependent oxidoreductase